MEQQPKDLNCESTPLRGYGQPRSGRRQDGIALILVLFFLALITLLVVAFTTSITTEYNAAKNQAAGGNARYLTNSAVSVVMGQIGYATQSQHSGSTTRYTWASQPGMIRTYDDTGASGNCYKLYSSGNMVIGGVPADVQTELAADVPAGWNNKPANFTDLNAPVNDVSGRLNYPVTNGNVKQINLNGVDILTYDDNGDSLPDIEGFQILPSSVPNYNGSAPISATNNPVPMPVQWMYVLKDGSLTTPDLPTAGAASTQTATWQRAADPKNVPTAANPIVGRIAFWTDDETCKLNINTASEGTYWAHPHVNSPTEISSPTKTFGYTISPPATREYNRYPGHPAATCLSVALGRWMNQSGTITPSAYTSDDSKYLADLAGYMQVLPKNQYGGSRAGTVKPLATPPVTTPYVAVVLDKDRLFASVDELMFDPSRNPSSKLTKVNLAQLEFFLTAQSRAPELTPFNTPKISMWPQWLTAADRKTYSDTTVTESAVAFCSSLGTAPSSSSATGKNEYFFQRNRAKNTAGPPVQLSSMWSSVQDWNDVPRNRQLANYLHRMGSKSIPGYGASFAKKYSSPTLSSIIVGSLDYIRWSVARHYYALAIDKPGGGINWVAPLVVTSDLPGASVTTPLKGFGNYPICTQVVLGVGIQQGGYPIPFLVFDFFQPSHSLPPLNPYGYEVKIENVENLGIPLKPGSIALASSCQITMNNADNGIYPPMRAYAAKLKDISGTGSESSLFDNTKPTVSIGTGQPVIITFMDREGNPIQKMTVKFPKVTVPTPTLAMPYGVDGKPVSPNKSLVNPLMSSLRGVECNGDASSPLKGDWRLLGTYVNVDQINGKDIYTPTANYSSPSYSQEHTLRTDYRPFSWTQEPTVPHGVTSPAHTAMTGSLTSLLKNTDYLDMEAPCVPFGLQAAINNNGRPGDWDTGPDLEADGPFTNPGLQTNYNQTNIYFNGSSSVEYQSISPNKFVASPVMLGSLPTGYSPPDSATPPQPWQTLLFCPNPAARTTSAGGTPTKADHAGFASPPDHTYLEFFTMPVVEPYPISEPLSTAGKVNLNYQIAPFTNIERSTALRGVLKNTLISGICGMDVKGDGIHPTTAVTRNYKFVPGLPQGNAYETRYDINRDATLAGIKAHYFDHGTIFKYPSEICDVFMVPQRLANATYNLGAAVPPTTYNAMQAWWAPTDLTTMSLTGDNLREEPYDRLYPRLTTKSNTYMVHYRVQMLQKSRTTKVDEWVEGKDVVTAEHRGSSLIERYVDPNDTDLDSNWDKNTMNVDFTTAPTRAGRTPDLSQYYKFRVISVKQFAP